MPQLDQSKAFPPRFEDGILYPAIYNLDELNMYGAPVGDNTYPGLYFSLMFPGHTDDNYGDNPRLSFGKHMFELRHSVTPTEYVEDEAGGYWDPDIQYPPLRPGSRIQFEFKDSKGLVIYSDVIKGATLATNDGFRGYVWLKLDPLRTYDFIEEGWGTFTIVGETIVAHNNKTWRGKYNVRTTFPIEIKLIEPIVNSDNSVSYHAIENTSPVYMRHRPTFIGSGSENGNGLFISESRWDGSPIWESIIVMSASKLETYGGKISNASLYFKWKKIWNDTEYDTSDTSPDAGVDGWIPVDENIPLQTYSTRYENYIDYTYAQGLNPISFETPTTGSSQIKMPYLEGDWVNYYTRFKIMFKDTSVANDYVADYVSSATHFEILYPAPPAYWLAAGSSSDSWFDDGVEALNWMSWYGATRYSTSTTFGGHRDSNFEMQRTGGGHFIFTIAPPSIRDGMGGQRADADGNLLSYGDDDQTCQFPPCGGGGGGPVN